MRSLRSSKVVAKKKGEAEEAKPTVVKANKKSSSVVVKKKKEKSFNAMSHLQLKRFADNDPTLTAGAKRDRVKHPHVALAEKDPSGRATCKLCGETIPKGTLRLGLMLECHKGYRNLCTLHQNCFWKHPEQKKLESVKEINFSKDLSKEQRATIEQEFEDARK